MIHFLIILNLLLLPLLFWRLFARLAVLLIPVAVICGLGLLGIIGYEEVIWHQAEAKPKVAVAPAKVIPPSPDPMVDWAAEQAARLRADLKAEHEFDVYYNKEAQKEVDRSNRELGWTTDGRRIQN